MILFISVLLKKEIKAIKIWSQNITKSNCSVFFDEKRTVSHMCTGVMRRLMSFIC